MDNASALKGSANVKTCDFRTWLERINAEGIRKEDVMDHFWEIDNKHIEDTLFWEEA